MDYDLPADRSAGVTAGLPADRSPGVTAGLPADRSPGVTARVRCTGSSTRRTSPCAHGSNSTSTGQSVSLNKSNRKAP